MPTGCSQIGRVELGHRRENRLEFRLIERLAGDVGVDQHAARAEILDRAPRFRDRAFDIGQAQRGGEGRETLRMLAAQLGHRVVGDAREVEADVGWRDVLDRRIGQAR